MDSSNGYGSSKPTYGGIFTISLDFELHWGVRDKFSVAQYGPALLGARAAIPRMLESFIAHDIHVTWATVGLLFHETKKDLLSHCPSILPEYRNKNLSPFPVLTEIGDSEASDPYHFAASLIRTISSSPGQEIASHTFSHFYCLEEGQSKHAFTKDVESAVNAAHSLGITLRSLVFPRNQCNPEYFDILPTLGIICYRGNPKNWIYSEGDDSSVNTVIRRAGRFADAFLPLTRPEVSSEVQSQIPINIPANRFLRVGRNGSSILDHLHLRRIKTEMRSAAQNGAVYHLWWHPHNFGTDMEQKLKALLEILRYYKQLESEFGMRSLSMREVAENQLSRSINDSNRTTENRVSLRARPETSAH
jgi:peptidoglycan/xylan/chitin deacetylase (PgdA/CDA1 family)